MDATALTELYDAFVQPLFRYGRRLTPDPALVKDGIHDVFADLWRYAQAGTLGEVDSVKFYLFRALKNRLLRSLRPGPVAFDSDRAEAVSAADSVPDVELRLVGEETDEAVRQRLQRAVDALPPRQKQAILLRFYDELSYAEIGELMGLTPQATYNTVYKALEHLRRHFTLYALALGYLTGASLLAALVGLFFF